MDDTTVIEERQWLFSDDIEDDIDDTSHSIDKKDTRKAFIKKHKENIKSVLTLTSKVLFAWLSLADWVTDILLLYQATRYIDNEKSRLESEDGDSSTNTSVSDADSRLLIMMGLAVSLYVSIILPYVISYSSGVTLFLQRKTFDNLHGIHRILTILYLLPLGVLYFIFLEVVELLLTILRLFLRIIVQYSESELKRFEETVAYYCGMDRMQWEGFKRQRSIAMFMFESLPQVEIF